MVGDEEASVRWIGASKNDVAPALLVEFVSDLQTKDGKRTHVIKNRPSPSAAQAEPLGFSIISHISHTLVAPSSFLL